MRACFPILLSVLCFACAGPGSGPDELPSGRPEGKPADPASGTVAKALVAGSLIRILPCELLQTGKENKTGVERSVVDGLLREALRQSPKFDFAAGFEDCASQLQIEVALDAKAEQLTTSLRMGIDAAIPLSTASYRDMRIDQAIDSLALELRRALGEQITIQPMASGAIYSKNPVCVRQCEAAFTKLIGNDRRSAVALWKSARRRDPGCTLVLCELARVALQESRAKEAAREVQNTLKHLAARISPTTQHRLARIFYMAKASEGSTQLARGWDQKLLELGQAGLNERPYDKHPLYTSALAYNYLSSFSESAPLLRQLLVRWPNQSWVAYHLAFADISLGEYENALDVIETSSRRLGGRSTFMPRALALYHCGKYAELRQQLERLAESPALKAKQTAEHSLLRMRASLEILTGHREAAAKFLLDDIDWLRKRPSLCERFALDLLDNGEVLIRLGYHAELGSRIAPLSQLGVVSVNFSQALTYLGARVLVSESDIMPTEAIRTLEKQQQHVWQKMLTAAVHRRRGELLAETRELSTAITQTDNALVRASLAQALDTMGKSAQAKELLEDLRTRLLKISLRSPLKHPLLNPAHALAFLATGSD